MFKGAAEELGGNFIDYG